MMIISTNHDIGQHHVDVDHHVIGYISVGIGNILNIVSTVFVNGQFHTHGQHHDDHFHHDLGQHEVDGHHHVIGYVSVGIGNMLTIVSTVYVDGQTQILSPVIVTPPNRY